MQLNGVSAVPIDYPTVPKGQGRIRIMIHAGNTEKEVDFLVRTICNWAKEMIDIEGAPESKGKVPKAAQQVYAMMADNA